MKNSTKETLTLVGIIALGSVAITVIAEYFDKYFRKEKDKRRKMSAFSRYGE